MRSMAPRRRVAARTWWRDMLTAMAMRKVRSESPFEVADGVRNAEKYFVHQIFGAAGSPTKREATRAPPRGGNCRARPSASRFPSLSRSIAERSGCELGAPSEAKESSGASHGEGHHGLGGRSGPTQIGARAALYRSKKCGRHVIRSPGGHLEPDPEGRIGPRDRRRSCCERQWRPPPGEGRNIGDETVTRGEAGSKIVFAGLSNRARRSDDDAHRVGTDRSSRRKTVR